MPFFRFTSDFVYWTRLKEEDHEKIKDILLPQIREKEKKENHKGYFTNGDALTSYFEKGGNDFLVKDELLNKIVWEPFDNMLNEYNKNGEYYNIKIKESMVAGGWYTSYKKNSIFGLHHHHTKVPILSDNTFYYSTFSFIYILNDPNDNNSTSFTSYDTFFEAPCNNEVLYKTSKNKDIKEGSVLIFPSRLLHSVDIPEIEGRVTIAYNVYSSF